MEGAVDVLWTLSRDRNGADLYVNASAVDAIEEELTRGQLSVSKPIEAWGEEAARAAHIVWREIQPKVPGSPDVLVRGRALPINYKEHITHNATSRWAEMTTDQGEVVWLREVSELRSTSAKRQLAIRELAEVSRSAIATLDEIAIRAARRLLDELLEQKLGSPLPDRAPIRPIRAFISYRTPDINRAQKLHTALTAYGDASQFDPYLDRHEERPGDLVAQLTKVIEESDLFIPICTPAYAADGSISAMELRLALTEAQRRGLSIAPVILNGGTPNWTEAMRPLSLHATSDDDLDVRSERFRRFATACARSVPVLDRRPATQSVGNRFVSIEPALIDEMRIAGHVRDALDSSPLADVCVTLGPPIRCFTRTQRDGSYEINLSALGASRGGMWDLYFLLDGYRRGYSGVFAVSGGVTVDVRLERIP